MTTYHYVCRASPSAAPGAPAGTQALPVAVPPQQEPQAAQPRPVRDPVPRRRGSPPRAPSPPPRLQSLMRSGPRGGCSRAEDVGSGPSRCASGRLCWRSERRAGRGGWGPAALEGAPSGRLRQAADGSIVWGGAVVGTEGGVGVCFAREAIRQAPAGIVQDDRTPARLMIPNVCSSL